MFIFDEEYVAATEYSEFLTDIAKDSNKKIIYDEQNWDQTGILTKIVAYEEKVE
jgi:hypothetical protein